jgi:hypothetical protein
MVSWQTKLLERKLALHAWLKNDEDGWTNVHNPTRTTTTSTFMR